MQAVMDSVTDRSSHQTMKDARVAYLAAAGLGDGGYDDAWVKLKMGPIPFAIPNTPSRKAAVPRHDLNHVLTAYETDWPGEFEISAFELASGCRHYWAAWVLNMGGLVAGMLVWPRRTLAAFWRGCQSRNSYYVEDEADILDMRVVDVREKLQIADFAERAPRSVADVARFFKIFGLALLFQLLSLAAAALPLAGLWWALH